MLTILGNSHAQQNSNSISLEELKSRFKNGNYSDSVLLAFHKTISNLREQPLLNEEIPNEIISWSTMMGEYSLHRKYLIQNNSIKEIVAIPKDEAFLKKLNSFVPEKSRFSYSSDLWSFPFVIQKLPGDYYLIAVAVRSFNSHPEIPSDDILMYDLEYKTKDFKKFDLVRLKDSQSEKWTEVSN